MPSAKNSAHEGWSIRHRLHYRRKSRLPLDKSSDDTTTSDVEDASEDAQSNAEKRDSQLIKALSKIRTDQASSKIEESGGGGGGGGEEDSLQREMLKDPRFGSPLLCDVVIMLLALVPLMCGFTKYISAKGSTSSSAEGAVGLSGYQYGLVLCGIFIFLLGLRSASLHLINRKDTSEERVLYILDKFGGSVWIPKIPEVLHLDPDAPSSLQVGGSEAPETSAGTGGGESTEAKAKAKAKGKSKASSSKEAADSKKRRADSEETYRVVLDPISSSVFLMSDRQQADKGGGRGNKQ